MAKKDISIRSIIIVGFVAITIITVSIIGFIVFESWISSTEKTTRLIEKDLIEEIFHELEMFIHVPKHINEVNRMHIETGLIDINDEVERGKFFVSVLQTHSNDIYSFSYGIQTGEYYGARRNEDGIIEIMKNNAQTGGNSWYYSVNDDLTSGELVVNAGRFDLRTRDWYKAAQNSKKPVFSPVYPHFVMKDLTVSAAYPIYNKDGSLQGVLGTHFLLASINSILKGFVQDKDGIAIILEKDSGELIANSFGMNNYSIAEDGTFKRLKPNDLNNQVVTQAYDHYLITNEHNFNIEYMNNRLFINVSRYMNDGLDWLIILAIPENLLMSSVFASMRLALVLVVLATSISILLYLLITKKLTNPMSDLIEVTEKFAAGDLKPRVKVVRHDEIGRIAVAFNKMADTINSLVNNLEETVRERTAELEESKSRLQLILDSTAEGIIGFDVNGNFTFCNSSCLKLLGYDNEEDLLNKNIHLQIHHSYRDGTVMPITECNIYKNIANGKEIYADDGVFWRADGSCFDVEYASFPQYKEGKLIGGVISFRDITARKKAEEEIRYLSSHDSLTGLLNRSYLERVIKKLDNEHNLPLSIIFADINGLKMTNDIFGHKSGDKLIKKSAEILKNSCRESDVVARVGGDEFVIILPITTAESSEKVMSRIKDGFSKAKIEAIKCSISVGSDTKTSMDQSIEQIMANAENAMYKEKTLNRKNINSGIIDTIIETLHEKSPKEKRHSFVVSELCKETGIALNLSETEIKKLEQAGFLHDIGKIILDKKILNEENLSQAERETMKQHSVVGYRILNLFDDTLDLAEGAYSHHERWDGQGYPKGLKGKEIPLIARVIAIAEVYDAMTNPFRQNPKDKHEAIEEIKRLSGVCFDPEIVDAFVGIIDR